MKTVKKLRKKIDSIDGKIVKLLDKRVLTAAEIVKIKCADGSPVYDLNRETEILSHVGSKTDNLKAEDVQFIYKVILDIIRKYL